MIGITLGGLGLFLLGMKLLTESLQALAGDALRELLRRYTRTAGSGVLLGALVTALIQSSSAVTLITLGFVSAGLLSFGSSLGVLYGANLGTTATAWIVAALGLKVKIDAFALPLVGVSGLLTVLLRGRWRQVALAFAAFGLLFVGIGMLQAGLSGFGDSLDPSRFARPGILGNLLLVLIGAVMTVILQSSSAAVVATLAAVDAGTITFPQAAALAIGQNVGTTATAVLAALGAPIVARRAAAAHIGFNVGTGVLAFALLPAFVWAVEAVGERLGTHDPAISLAIFHSAFNILGVALFLPFNRRYAALLTRWIPEVHRSLTHRLVDPGGPVPDLRLEAARRTALDLARATVALSSASSSPATAEPQALRDALRELRAYLHPLQTGALTEGQLSQHIALLHAIDHIERLLAYLALPQEALAASSLPAESLGEFIEALDRRLGEHPGQERAPFLHLAKQFKADVQRARDRVLVLTARGELDAVTSGRRLDALRRASGLVRHGRAIVTHLSAADYAVDGVPGQVVVEVVEGTAAGTAVADGPAASTSEEPIERDDDLLADDPEDPEDLKGS